MERELRSLCEKYDLTCISVMLQHEHSGCQVYVHWDDGRCVSSHGDTFADAFQAALAEMDNRRTCVAGSHLLPGGRP